MNRLEFSRLNIQLLYDRHFEFESRPIGTSYARSKGVLVLAILWYSVSVASDHCAFKLTDSNRLA